MSSFGAAELGDRLEVERAAWGKLKDSFKAFDKKIVNLERRLEAVQTSKPVAHLDSSPNVQKASLDFIVVGDWGDGGPGANRVAEGMHRLSKECSMEFVVSTGDNFYPEGLISAEHFEYVFTDVYVKPFRACGGHLDKQWYAVLGNHDYNEYSVETQFTGHPWVSRSWHLEEYYHRHFELPQVPMDVDIFFLDTIPAQFYPDMEFMHRKIEPQYSRFNSAEKPYIDKNDLGAWGEAYWGEEVRWLEDKLEEVKALRPNSWKIVVSHYCMYSISHHAQFLNQNQKMRQLEELLKHHNVHAYFSGHEHTLEHYKLSSSSVHYFISGAGCKAGGWPQQWTRQHDEELPGYWPMNERDRPALLGLQFQYNDIGFLTVSVCDVAMTIRFHDASGIEVKKVEIKKQP